MSVEITKHVKIVTGSLEPLEMTVDAAVELRDALISAFPLPSSTAEIRSQPDKWVLRGKTWRKGSLSLSSKMVGRVQNVVGKEWKLIDDITGIIKASRPSVLRAVSVLEQEGKVRIRGHGKTTAVQSKGYDYTPQRSDIQKIEVVEKEHDFTVLQKEQKLKREQMRKG